MTVVSAVFVRWHRHMWNVIRGRVPCDCPRSGDAAGHPRLEGHSRRTARQLLDPHREGIGNSTHRTPTRSSAQMTTVPQTAPFLAKACRTG
jgi:hypothetical protein